MVEKKEESVENLKNVENPEKSVHADEFVVVKLKDVVKDQIKCLVIVEVVEKLNY